MTDLSTTSAPTLLRPDWARPSTWLPQLAAHLSGPPSAGALHLDATRYDPPAEIVHPMLTEAIGALTTSTALPEIVLHDDAAELAAVGPLPAPPMPPERPAATPEGALARARDVKAIADAARDRIDRWRFAQTAAPGTDDPLVTVRIPTWRGHETLVNRTLPSVLKGGYDNLEVLVCSDGPDPECRAMVEEVARRDSRVRFLELDERPVYPQAKANLHRIGGTRAANATIDAARGAFQCPLDHDDAFTIDHVPVLLQAIRQSGCDFVYGQAMCEIGDGTWGLNGFSPLRKGDISHGTVMYSSRLAHMRYDEEAWILGEPGDWNMWRRMVAAGARSGLVPTSVLVHFAERTSIDSVHEAPPEPDAAQALADVRATPAAWLLHVAL